jgi:hypothetical protein
VTRATGGQVARAGAVGAVALGVAVALLQALQGVVGSFNPRWQVTALFALAGICASLLVQRLTVRRSEARAAAERDALLRSTLRQWPVARLAETPDDQLGVFPRCRRDGDGPYAARELDEPLRDALRDSALVVIVGPARAGKSRTAAEATRAALPAARVVIPRNAECLRRLLEFDPPLDLRDDEAVLWLDGLERFLDALDGAALDQLTQQGMRAVATVREDTWERFLTGDGQNAEATRALAARARVYQLPAKLKSGEHAVASQLYPGRDLTAGIGVALATTGRDSEAPPPRPHAHVEQQRATRGRGALRDVLLVGPGGLGGAALIVIAILALVGEFEQPKPATIADQAQEARREGSVGSRQVVDAERADFHGSGEPSYFYVFGDAQDVTPAEARSDELQVFDQQGDELERAFRFEPRPVMLGAGAEPALFQFRFIGDIDGDGADELVGGYGTPAIRGELLLPFAVDWDEDAQRYRVVSLAPKPARLASPARGDDVAGLRAAYATPLNMTDVESKDKLAGYRAQDFAVSADPHRLVGAYVSDVRQAGSERLVELQPSNFGRTGGRPQVTPCKLIDSGPVMTVAPTAKARPLHLVTLEQWLKASKDRFCIPAG